MLLKKISDMEIIQDLVEQSHTYVEIHIPLITYLQIVVFSSDNFAA